MINTHGGKAAIEIFDTTLRDGAQGEGVSFSVRDKIAVAEALDELAVAFVEAGNPGSNPKDAEFFAGAHTLRLKHSKLCAFGSTRKKGSRCADDTALASLLAADTEVVVIFGKSWKLQTGEVLKVTPEENLNMRAEEVAFLRENGRRVFYDAEHFFDGYKDDSEYALETLRAAFNAGAETLVLCDTNGGCFPDEISGAVSVVAGAFPNAKIGIHCHDDMGLASACTIAAVNAGCTHVQGTLLGFGERCGNTPLAAVIPSLELKLGKECLPPGKLLHLGAISRRIAEIANRAVPANMPYIGASAFSHKAGMHADAILKVRASF